MCSTGMYTLTTQTLPVLTYLKNWDKLFESFKSDVYSSSHASRSTPTRHKPSPSATKDFGAVRLRAFGTTAIASPTKRSIRKFQGTRDRYTTSDPGQASCAAWSRRTSATPLPPVAFPFLDLAASQQSFAAALTQELAPAFEKVGSSSKV